MVIYLDMCCLKRPFDDQSQPRIRLESDAVLAMLAAESAEIEFIRSAALRLENSRNPLKERARRVDQWLVARDTARVDLSELARRTTELMQLGFKNFDALHIASGELANAVIFATCDDGLLNLARKNGNSLKIQIMGVLQLAEEILK